MSGTNDGIAECAFCVGTGEECFSDESQLGGVVSVVAGLVLFEARGEFVGVRKLAALHCGPSVTRDNPVLPGRDSCSEPWSWWRCRRGIRL